MESPVERLVILALAPRAHREFLHRRVLAIVGELLDDRKPRPAVRAVDKRVAVSPIVGVHKLAGAILARCQIGRNERGLLHGSSIRKPYLEGIEALERYFLERQLVDLRSGGRVFRKLDHELVEQLALALCVDEHAVGRIENPTVDQVFFCHTVNKGAEAHPLYDSADLNV